MNQIDRRVFLGATAGAAAAPGAGSVMRADQPALNSSSREAASEALTSTRAQVFHEDENRLIIPGSEPKASHVPLGTDVEGVYFEGYPQLIKDRKLESPPVYKVARDKDVPVALRDGMRIRVDVYRPDVEGAAWPGAAHTAAQRGSLIVA